MARAFGDATHNLSALSEGDASQSTHTSVGTATSAEPAGTPSPITTTPSAISAPSEVARERFVRCAGRSAQAALNLSRLNRSPSFMLISNHQLDKTRFPIIGKLMT